MDDVIENGEVKYAGFWRRLAAVIIDTLIFVLPSFLFVYIVISVTSTFSGSDYTFSKYIADELPSGLDFFLQALSSAFWIVIYAYLLSSKWQATPGKRIMNAYVVTTSGNRLSFKQAVFRTVLPFLILFPMQNMASSPAMKKEANEYYLNTLFEVMPDTAVEFKEGSETPEEFIGRIYGEPHLRAVYMDEFEKLSQNEKNQIQSASKRLSSYGLSPQKGGMILFFNLMFLIWYIMAAFTPQKTAMHDIIANTRVIKGRA